MAAPLSTNILDMSGVWVLSKKLSDDFDATFAAQGIAWPIRKILALAGVSLHMTQSKLPPEGNAAGEPVVSVQVKQVVSPGGFNSQDSFILDSQPRETTVPIFGLVTVRAGYVPLAELKDTELRQRLQGGGADVVIQEIVESKKNGWETVGTWGFEEVGGERRFTRTSVTTIKSDGTKTVARLVYDFRAE